MKPIKYLALAALVAFAACDSGSNSPVTESVTGSITGTVSIEGTGASGVTVTLSSGTNATTDGSGHYTFSSVPAGAYTVSISGFASDATFATSAKAASIASAGQVVTVDFDGTYIRTSAIIGSVKVDDSGLSGVTVSISGAGSGSKTTDSNGQTTAFSGLRAGSYTVTISGYDATNYTFTQNSKAVTLATGELQVVEFDGTVKTTAAISGSLFLDEAAAAADSMFESNLESKLAVANVPIQIEGGTVLDTMTVMTDANGDFSFPNLAAGTYRVMYKGTAANVPGNVAFEGGSYASQIVGISTGAQQVVNFPFRITKQAIKVYAFLGGNVSPIPGWMIDLYDTQANAQAGGGTGKLASTVTTDATGAATFRFTRSTDKGPNGTAADQIVFARSNTLPAGPYTMTSASGIIEIHFPTSDSVSTAPDTLAATYSSVTVAVRAMSVTGDSLNGWTTALRDSLDKAGSVQATSNTDAHGWAYYTVTPINTLPDTLWVRLGTSQAAANGHGFATTLSALQGSVVDPHLKYIWKGTVLPSDTIWLGVNTVKYTDADLKFGVHHELDDSTDVPTFSGGDDAAGSTSTQVELYKVRSNGTKVSMGIKVPAAFGNLSFKNLPVDSMYEAHIRVTAAPWKVLKDSVVTAPALNGGAQIVVDSTLAGSHGASSFAIKAKDNEFSGFIRARDLSVVPTLLVPVQGIIVTLTPTADNIQGTSMKVDTTDASGAYDFTGLLDGPYMVSAAEQAGKWQFFDSIDSNTTASTSLRDLNGMTAHQTASFRIDKMNTKVSGLVFNDRDLDNTQDVTDALSGAVMELVQAGSVVATDTTDGNGAYSFLNLRQGTYMVRWVAGTPNTDQDVLRALNTDSVIVMTTPTANVGSTTPGTLPQWNYGTTAPAVAGAADFLFLAKNTIAKGYVKTGGGAGVANMVISLRRCNTSTGAAKPPVADDGGAHTCTSFLGTTVTAVSDASGYFEFDNLIEGVYRIAPNPGTVGGYTLSTPAAALYLQQNPADIETFTFTVS